MATLTFPTLLAIADRPGHALSVIEDFCDAGDQVFIEDMGLLVVDPEEPSTASQLTLAAIDGYRRICTKNNSFRPESSPRPHHRR